MKRKYRWMLACFLSLVLAANGAVQASGLPGLEPGVPTLAEDPEDPENPLPTSETPEADDPSAVSQTGSESESDPTNTEESPETTASQPEEDPGKSPEMISETEAFVTQMIKRKAGGSLTTAGSVDVRTSGESSADENLQSGLLLAKRLKKLAAESEFNKIVFRGSAYVNVRAEATSASAKVGMMYYNAVATVLTSEYHDDGLWYEIQSGKVHGYVKSVFFVSGADAMDLIGEITGSWVEMKDDSQRLYEVASTDSVTLTTLSSGIRYKSAGTDGGFTKVYIGDTPSGTQAYGYVPTDKLIISRDVLTAVTESDESAKQSIALKVVEVQNSLEESRRESREAASREASRQASIAESRRRESSAAASRQAEMERMIAEQNLREYSKYIPAGTSAKRRGIVEEALKYVKVLDYVWGGESLTYGADCSGFCRAIFAKFGISVTHYTVVIAKEGTAVSSLAAARPGDLICYHITSDSGHVGIYIGNGYVVHAPRTGEKVRVNKADFMSITTIRNVIGD